MGASSNREVVDRFYQALNTRRFNELADLAQPDAVQEWPQSGERFSGRDAIRAVFENYPGLPTAETKSVVGAEDKWVLTPSWTPLRITGTGDYYTVENRISYPNGEMWHGVVILQFRDGKVSKLTEYFAAPFPAAEWRARWAEKMESPTQKA